MGNRNENTIVGLVPRIIALAVALVITGVIATGFASATNRIPVSIEPLNLASIHN
jgi:hypothetical protein